MGLLTRRALAAAGALLVSSKTGTAKDDDTPKTGAANKKQWDPNAIAKEIARREPYRSPPVPAPNAPSPTTQRSAPASRRTRLR